MSGAVQAQDLPALYDVTGVAKTDQLNLRAAPSASADILGTLSPDATGIEVIGLSEDGKWGRVGMPEANGWLAMRFLKPQPLRQDAPPAMRCIGTEPFWSLSHRGETGSYATPEAPQSPLATVAGFSASEGYFLQYSGENASLYSLHVAREACSDGMSDREFGFSARLFIKGGQANASGNASLRGCCTLDMR